MKSMKVLIAGDFAPNSRCGDVLSEGNYDAVFDEVRPIIKQHDYSIVNFECAVVDVIHEVRPIDKVGPKLSCTSIAAEAIAYAGFNCTTLANNHMRDYGDKGVRNTINFLQRRNIDFVGGGVNSKDASKTLYKTVAGKKLAIINCCETEFNIATDSRAGANPLNPIQQYYAILEAKEKADVILVIIHGGSELLQVPTPRMIETYRFFIDSGADAVINHHQHCLCGYEVYKGKPIFYGLGNFCFDRPNEVQMWYEGMMISIDFGEETCFDVIPYTQCKDDCSIKFVDKKVFLNRLEELNQKFKETSIYSEEIRKHYNMACRLIHDNLEPIKNRWLNALQKRGLFPSFLTRKKSKRLFNLVYCESHRDKLYYYLKDILHIDN